MTICHHCGELVPASRYGATWSLCPDCVRNLREEYYANRPDDDLAPVEEYDPSPFQGKRQDQIEFSVVAALIAFLLVGLSIGIAIANVTTPTP